MHPDDCDCAACVGDRLRTAWRDLRDVVLAEPPMPRVTAALDRFLAWAERKLTR